MVNVHFCDGCYECEKRSRLYKEKVSKAPSISILKSFWDKFKLFIKANDSYQILIIEKDNIAYLYLNNKPIHCIEGDNLILKSLKLIKDKSNTNIKIIYQN